MSQPAGPYRGDRRLPHHSYQQPYDPHQQSYDPHQQPYDPHQQPYDPYEQPYGPYQQPYDPQPRYAPVVVQGPPHPPAPPAVRPRRIPGFGLVLTLLGLVVQVLSLTVLPWALLDGGTADGGTAGPVAMPEIWRLVTEHGTHGFGGWYVVLFNYPLAALGILLALASVLESVALKIIWGGLAIIGLGILVLRYGLGPFTGLANAGTGGRSFTTQEITTATIALAALVAVIFMLRMAVSTFRRIAGLILLGVTGVHVAAVWDLVNASGAGQLSVGAYGSAIGYALIAVAALTGPRRLPGI
jgi:hypothetical protein